MATQPTRSNQINSSNPKIVVTPKAVPVAKSQSATISKPRPKKEDRKSILGLEKSFQLKKGKHPKKKPPKSVWIKDIILGIVNLGFILGMVYLLQQLPAMANQINTLRSSVLLVSATGDIEVQIFDLNSSKEKTDRLLGVFPDEDALLVFVNEIEELKTDGTIVGFTFGSEVPVKDKTKNVGIPIKIDFRGSWDDIGRDIETIQRLPYIFRPVTLEAEEFENEGIVDVIYGGFLYVDKSLEKN